MDGIGLVSFLNEHCAGCGLASEQYNGKRHEMVAIQGSQCPREWFRNMEHGEVCAWLCDSCYSSLMCLSVKAFTMGAGGLEAVQCEPRMVDLDKVNAAFDRWIKVKTRRLDREEYRKALDALAESLRMRLVALDEEEAHASAEDKRNNV